jgi:TRAP transporter TAXI family solute receptor
MFVRRDGPVQHVSDLRGRRVAVAPVDTGDALLWGDVLRAYGLNESDLTILRHPNSEMGRFFEEERLDAMVMVSAFDPRTITAPIDPIQLRILPLEGREVSWLRSQYLHVGAATVSPAEMEGSTKPVPTLLVNSVIICRADLSEDVVYRFATELYAVASTNNPLGLDPDSLTVPISLHPGAARYYRERELLK